MARRWWKRLLVAIVPLLFLWGWDYAQTIYWVGSTDLEIEFAITDATTGAPIPGARVEIQQDKGGFYEDKDEREFVLVAGGDGLACQECRRSMCFGTRSGLGITDTFVVHLPEWQYRVVSEGYESSDWAFFEYPKFHRQVRRAGPRNGKLVVPISLHKKQAEPAAAPDRCTCVVG